MYAIRSYYEKELSREELVAKDKAKLTDAIDSYSVNKYRFIKICLRSVSLEDTTMAEFVAFKNEAKAVAKLMDQIDYEESLSLADYYTIYKAYSRMSDQVKKTDEDVFPLLMESFAFLYKDSLSDHQPLMVGEEKAAFQCAEHGVLSAVTTLWKSLGASVALYEASKTNTELLGDNEVKALLSYYRAFLFLQHGLYYLSEKEYTENIVWLDNNKFVNLPITKSFFGWERLPNERAYVGFHALNYLARGLTRLAMPYEKDNELGIDDLDVFLDDFEELNIQHECVWSIQAYLYLHRNQPEEAIGSLKKLQASKILSSDEQKVIAESIVYLEKREGDALLSGVYDKVFLTRVATSYVYSIIKKTDWEKILKDNDVPHADDMIIALKKLEHISNKLDGITGDEAFEDAKEKMKEEGSKLLDQAKGLF